MIGQKYRVVMIDDQTDFLKTTKEGLEDFFQVYPFTRPREALEFLESQPVDAVLLDYHLGEGDCAWNTFAELQRMEFEKPVLVLTGEADVTIKLDGLDRGVDDYLQKPISPVELGAHLRNRIRSSRKRTPQILKFSNLEMNLLDPQIQLDDRPVLLTNKEFEILRLLVTYPNTVISKSMILEKIWADVAVEKNNIDTHMSNLRRKLHGFACQIKTIKKIGYVLRT